MYCIKCGNQLKENDIYCPKCGYKNNSAAMEKRNNEAEGTAVAQIKEKDTVIEVIWNRIRCWFLNLDRERRWFVLAVAVGVIMISVITGIKVSEASNYTAPVYNFVEMMNTGNTKLLKKVLPMEYFNKYYQDSLEEYVEEMADGAKYSVEIIGKRELDTEELADTEDFLSWFWNGEDLEIQKGYELTVEVNCTAADGQKSSKTGELHVIQINGKWYLDISDI